MAARRRLLSLLSLAAAAALSASAAPTMVSICGDPGMMLPPKILLEGWSFCNRCGRACSEAPRWADCVGPDGAQRVSPAANAAGLAPAAQTQAACDAFTEQKERDLGGLCADPIGGANGSSSFFWTAMIKSGAMNVSERGLLCGLWCADKQPNCNAAAELDAMSPLLPVGHAGPASWMDANGVMRQPRVVHEWSSPDGADGWTGAFYGTYDETANLTALPTPAELIAQALAPMRPGCSLAGAWLGAGDARLVIDVAQAPGAPNFSASCTWAPAPGLPAPWTNASGTLNNMTVTLSRAGGGEDNGFAVAGEGQSADLVCWSPASFWCRSTSCDGGAPARCAAALALRAAAAAAAATAAVPVSSYFGMQWVSRAGRRVHRHVLRTGDDLGWIMLYTGPEAATGLKGGYEWDGRGQYAPVPLSTTRNASAWDPTWGARPSNNFQVVQWTNITLWPGGPGFYFLNMGACWKDTGVECDGDITTDVTRYLLFQLPAPGVTSAPAAERCGPGAQQRALCPPSHRYRNGTVVGVDDAARFPYRAYHSVSQRERGADGAFRCKHDCWSNPCDQDWVRIEPSPEWAEYGFPESVAAAMSPHLWTMDVGAVTAQLASSFSGETPPLLAWTTLNIGPEMQGPPGRIAVWEVAMVDVLVEAAPRPAVSL